MIQRAKGLRIESKAWKWRGDKLLMQYRVIRPNGSALTDWGEWPSMQTLARLRREVSALDNGTAAKGNPCKRGHDVRYISSGQCVQCYYISEHKHAESKQKAP